MQTPPIVSRPEWDAAHATLLAREKELTRARDRMAAERRRMPWLGGTWSYLDITALGRQEKWEDSPEGYPQTPPYAWWRWHDDYGS